MATGFAAFLLYMKITRKDGNRYFGVRDGVEYEIKDDSAAYFQEIWEKHTPAQVAEVVIRNTNLWEGDLAALPGFLAAVQQKLAEFEKSGVFAVVAAVTGINEKVH